MAGDGTTYTIDIDAPTGKAEAAASAVDTLADRLKNAGAAASTAAEAVKAGEVAYAQAEASADRAAKALEKIGLAAEAQRGKLQAAMDAGDAKGADRAAAKLQNLVARQAEAAKKAQESTAAMNAQAASLDAMRAAADKAADEQKHLASALDGAKKAAKAQEELAAAAKGTGNLGKLSGALGQLGGPLGTLGNKATGTADAIADLTETVGAAGPYVALAVAVVALTAAVAAAGIAATKWAIGMADAARGTNELAKRSERLKKLTTSLFAGPKVQGAFDKFLGGLDSLVDLFDENNASGKAMRVVFEDIFGKLIGGASEFLPKVRSAFIQFEILVLKALIAIKPFGSTIVEVGKYLAMLAGIVIGVLVGAIAAGIAVFVAFIALPQVLGQKFAALGASISEFFSTLDLGQMATDMMTGLINGITNAGPAAIKAISGVVGGAVDAAKNLLGISSPSKVFAEIGTNTGEGMVQGVDDSAGAVQSSLETMVAPPDPAAAGPGAATASASGGGGNTFNFTINATDAGSAQTIADKVREVLIDVLEGDVTQAGLGAASA